MGIERQPLETKMQRYLDASLSFETVLAENAGGMSRGMLKMEERRCSP
jgi:hypothetical protein